MPICHIGPFVFRPLQLAKEYYDFIVEFYYADGVAPVGVKLAYWSVACLYVMGVRGADNLRREMETFAPTLDGEAIAVFNQAVDQAIAVVGRRFTY